MTRAGPKPDITVPRLDLRGLPPAGGARVVAFCEKFLRVPKGTGAKQRLKLRGWQQEIVRGLFDDPRPRHGLVAIPRGNGKTTLAAALGLYALFADEVEGAQVLCVASDQRQAGIVFNTARRMVELDERLSSRTHILKDRLRVPQTDSWLIPLPAEPGALQGYDPSLAVVDELHVVTDPVYEAMSAAAGKRDRSLVLAISTASGDTDGVMWRLVEQGRFAPDPAFYFTEFAAPPSCDLDDEDAWAIANPALDDFLHRDALRSNLKTLRASSFRRFRLGQWVSSHDTWLPDGAWDACEAAVGLSDGVEVVIGLDGSFSQDATALVAVSVAETPHIDVVDLWEPPADDPGYRVPVADVEEAIREACRRWQVREIVADPYRWTRSLQALEAEGLPVSEFPQSPSRMTPATTGLYEAVVNQQVTHSGDPRLARHVGNCVVRVDSRGTRLAKEHKHSLRRIDLAVAAVMAHSRATWLAGRAGVQLFTFDDDEA
jgi:phage terminase large subunit-like protein